MTLDYMYLMGDTERHLDLVGEFYRSFKNLLFGRSDCKLFTDGAAIVYFGKKRLPDGVELKPASDYIGLNLTEFSWVEPDFTLFAKNPYISNSEKTRFAGQPDLVVEIWSKSNDEFHKNFHKYLYSTSPVTEHWYLEQDSNEVECWFGEKKINSQNLSRPLVTQSGLKIDLSHLAL